MDRSRCAGTLEGVARGVMHEQLPSVRHGDWVLVDDVAGYEGRVIVVIGVIAVIRVRREDGGDDTCRAAEVHRCRPLGGEADADPEQRPARPGSRAEGGDEGPSFALSAAMAESAWVARRHGHRHSRQHHPGSP